MRSEEDSVEEKTRSSSRVSEWRSPRAHAQTDEQGANREAVQSASAPSIVQFQEVNSIAKSLASSRFSEDQVRTDTRTEETTADEDDARSRCRCSSCCRASLSCPIVPDRPTDRPIDRGGRRGPFAFYSMKVLEQNLVRFHDHDEKGQQSRPASHATFATV